MPAPASRTAPALPPKVAVFRAALDSTAKVDAAAGTMSGIAVSTANQQPMGWPMWTDEKSLDSLIALFKATGNAKSYITHDGAPWADRQGREIGLFAGFRKEGAVFRADFEAMAAFRKHEQKDFDKLFELALKAPATFGVSPVFEYGLVWVRQNGEEIPTEVATYRYDDIADDYLPVFDPTAPADAANPLPSWRASRAMSIDFTDMPAGNPALFSAKPRVDAPANDKPPVSPPAMHQKLFAKFRQNPAQFARAVELHESDTTLSFDSVVSTVEREGTAAEIATLRENVKKTDGEIATLRGDLKKRDDEIVTLKAQATKDSETIAAFRKGGTPPIETGAKPAEAADKSPAATLRAELQALNGKNDAESSVRRGQITAQLRELRNPKKSGFILRPLLAFLTLIALFALFVPRGIAVGGFAGGMVALLAVAALGAGLMSPHRARLGRACLTLTVSEITSDLIAAFVQTFPILTKMGLDLRASALKLNKQEIAHITTLPTASTYVEGSGGYSNGAVSARSLLADVPVTPDQWPTCPIYWKHLDQITDQASKYGDAIKLTGYVLAKAVIDNICQGFTTRNFSKELVIAAADLDYDKVAAITSQCNVQQMTPIGRAMIVNSDVAAVLDADVRITSKDYSGQQTGGKGIRTFRNVGGFELIQEYPDLPSNNGTDLTGVTATAATNVLAKAAHGLLTGDPVIISAIGGGAAGLAISTRYWAIKVDADSFKLATTYALAVAGTEIDVTTDSSSGHLTLAKKENLIAFAFDMRAIAVLAGIPENFDSAELLAALNIQKVMSMTAVTEETSQMTMAGVSWQEAGTGRLYYSPTFIWGKGLGRQAAAASAVNVLTDYAGLRIASA